MRKESPPRRGPRPGRSVGTANSWTPAQARVLDVLEDHAEPVTVTRLSTETGLHENTIRSHLEALDSAGAVTRSRAPIVKRGRPAWLYAAAQGRDRSELTGFAVALASALRRESVAPKRAAVSAGHAWGAVVGAERRPATAEAVTRRTWVTQVLAELGFEPEAEAEAAPIRITRCPVLDVARTDPDVVCSVHLGMIRGSLRAAGLPESGVRLSPFHEPGACRLELDEVAAPPARA